VCNFLSALAFQNGDVFTNDYTDSHDHLLILAGVTEQTGRECCRVEFSPNGDIDNPATYRLIVDEQREPEWFANVRERVENKLRAKVNAMMIRGNRPIICGGMWIVCDGAYVGDMFGGRLVAICRATVKTIYGGTVKDIFDGTVKAIRGGTVESIRGGTVESIRGGTVKGDYRIKPSVS